MASPKYYKLVPVSGNEGDAFDHSPPIPSPNSAHGNAYPMSQQQRYAPPPTNGFAVDNRSPNGSVSMFPKAEFPVSNLGGYYPHNPIQQQLLPQQQQPNSRLQANAPFPAPFAGFAPFPGLPVDMRQQMDAMRQSMFSDSMLNTFPGGHIGGQIGGPGFSPQPSASLQRHQPQLGPRITTDPVTGGRRLTLTVDVAGYEPAEVLINTDGDVIDILAKSQRDGQSRQFRQRFTLPCSVRDCDMRCSFQDDGHLLIEADPDSRLTPAIQSTPPHHGGGLLMPAYGSLNRKKKRVTFALQ